MTCRKSNENDAMMYLSVIVVYGFCGRVWLTANWKATAVSIIVKMIESWSASSFVSRNKLENADPTML